MAPQGGVDDVEFASRVIGYCVDSWNRKLMQRQARANSVPDKRTARRVERITKELVAYFDPVLMSVENDFRPDYP